jgi:hypothetical protein
MSRECLANRVSNVLREGDSSMCFMATERDFSSTLFVGIDSLLHGVSAGEPYDLLFLRASMQAASTVSNAPTTTQPIAKPANWPVESPVRSFDEENVVYTRPINVLVASEVDTGELSSVIVLGADVKRGDISPSSEA